MKDIDRLRNGIFNAIDLIDEILDDTSLGDHGMELEIRRVANRLHKVAHGEKWEETEDKD